MTNVIEFFCGIGGLANCLPEGVSCTGIDISGKALEIYQRNFGHPVICKAIESLSVEDLPETDSDDVFWWMSPPCQPHTSRGLQLDLEDRRSAALINMVQLIRRCRPAHLGLENVPGFADSESRELLESALQDCGYAFRSLNFCPTSLGEINRRPRFYLIASRAGIDDWQTPQSFPRQSRLQDDADRQQLSIEQRWLDDYAEAIHTVSADDFLSGAAVTRCFTSGYGRSPVQCGSYFFDGQSVRLFSPLEILWQLGFPAEFYLPRIPYKRLWPSVGNSVSRAAVGYLLQHLRVDSFSNAEPVAHAPPVDGLTEG